MGQMETMMLTLLAEVKEIFHKLIDGYATQSRKHKKNFVPPSCKMQSPRPQKPETDVGCHKASYKNFQRTKRTQKIFGAYKSNAPDKDSDSSKNESYNRFFSCCIANHLLFSACAEISSILSSNCSMFSHLSSRALKSASSLFSLSPDIAYATARLA